MREFFRGWKRKVGVVTLLMACVFAGAWVRSKYVHDTVTIVVDEHTFDSLTSSVHGVAWCRSRYRRLKLTNVPKISWTQNPMVEGDRDDESDELHELEKSYIWYVFATDGDPRSHGVIVRFGAVVLPLMLLSALLFLGKQRPGH